MTRVKNVKKAAEEIIILFSGFFILKNTLARNMETDMKNINEVMFS